MCCRRWQPGNAGRPWQLVAAVTLTHNAHNCLVFEAGFIAAYVLAVIWVGTYAEGLADGGGSWPDPDCAAWSADADATGNHLQVVRVGTYAEALAGGGGGRPGQSVKAAGVEAKRPGWHAAGPDVVKYIETSAPGTEVCRSEGLHEALRHATVHTLSYEVATLQTTMG